MLEKSQKAILVYFVFGTNIIIIMKPLLHFCYTNSSSVYSTFWIHYIISQSFRFKLDFETPLILFQSIFSFFQTFYFETSLWAILFWMCELMCSEPSFCEASCFKTSFRGVLSWNSRFLKRSILQRDFVLFCSCVCVWSYVNEKWLRKGGKFDSCTLVKNWNNWAPFGPTCVGCPAAITFHVNFVVEGQIDRFLSDVRRNTKRRECRTWAGSRHVSKSIRTWCSKKMIACLFIGTLLATCYYFWLLSLFSCNYHSYLDAR